MRRLLATITTLLILLGTTSTVFADKPKVLIQTNKGNITLELDRDKAPLSVQNFLTYVDEGFYNGTIFHRVIEGFMIQGGGFDKDFKKRPTHDPIKNEADNGLKNERGTVAMARTSDPHSATAQFFINHKDNDFLNHRSKDRQGWGYAVFGRVTDGMDVVDEIATTATGPGGPFRKDVPQETILIQQVTRIDG
jgi:peptidyl-prolyl cis-trans isomerase B (cyclophilin B)